MIRFACACGRQLQARDGQAGARAVCPICGQETTVPDAADTGPAEPWVAHPASLPDPSDRPVPDGEPAGRTAGRFGGRGRVSWLAVDSFVLAIVSFCTCTLSPEPDLRPLTTSYVLAAGHVLLTGLAATTLWRIRRSKGRLTGMWMASIGLLAGLFGTAVYGYMVPAAQSDPPRRTITALNWNLRQIALAMNTYALDKGKGFPPSAIRAPDGKPLLSWRVAILPYMEEEDLYARFHLDEPWDSPHNKKLLPLMPKTYAYPGGSLPDGLTRFQVYVGPGAAFEGPGGIRPEEFTDGLARTILVVQGAEPVPWTKPIDLPFGPEVVLVRPHERGGYYHVVMADASVASLPADTPEETLRALITRNGGEPVQWP